ncbi:MAG TPA: hypothetical protein VLE51_03260 [Candidatus Saccharimonadales bacterium]|nr:hypothetical protein [Candidatus Saccharimonadales bacterium]
MRAVILYHPHSEHGGVVEDYTHEYKRFKNKALQLVSLETRDGAATASLYDITSYPAILVLSDDGSALKIWQGLPLPLMNEIEAYLRDYQPSYQEASLE